MGNIEKFDLIAPEYDTLERLKVAKIIADEIRICITDGKGKDAVDYGCGTGLIGMQLLDNFGSMFFIDASPNMIGEVQQKISQAQIDHVKALCYDFVTQPPLDLHVDYVIMVHTLIHIKEVKEIIVRLYSVLNEGGRLFIVDFDQNGAVISDEVHNGFEQEKLKSLLREVGFADIRSKTFYYGKKLFMNQDASIFILDSRK